MAKKLTFEDIQSVIAPQPKQAGASSIDDILGKYLDTQPSSMDDILGKYLDTQPSSMDDILGKFQTSEKIDQVTNYPSLENYGKLNVSKYNPNYVPEKKKDLGFFKGIGSSFAAGSAELGQGAARMPSFLLETAALPQNLLANITGWKWLEAKSPEWLKNNPVAKYYDKQVQAWDESLAASDMKIIENFQSGNIKEGFENIAYMTARTIPLTISLMAGGYASAGSGGANIIKEGIKTAAPIGAYAGAQKKQQLDTQNPELSEFTKTFNALMSGAGEGMSETLGTVNVGRLGRELMESMGKETFKKVAKDNIIQSLYKRLNNSYLLTGAVSEGIEEVVAGVLENLTDKYTGADPDRKILEGTGDQFIVGLFAGGLTTTPFSLANKVAKKVEEREYVKQVNTYADLLTEQVTNKQTGEIVIAQNGKGEQFHVIDNAGDNVLVVANKQTGEISMMSEKEVQVTETIKPEDFRKSIIDQAMNKVTEENVEQATDELIEEELVQAGEIAYKQGDVVDFQGKAFVVDQVNPDGIIAHPMDGDPLIDGREITTEELAMPYDPETGEARPQDVPLEKTFQFGKEEVKYFEKEDGSSFIPIEEGMDPNKLMKVINSEVDLTQFDVIPITEEIPIEGAPAWAKKKSEVVTVGISIVPKGMVQPEVTPEVTPEEVSQKEITPVDSAIAVFKDSQSLEDFKGQVSPEEYSAFEQRFNPGKGLTEQQTYEKAVDELMGDKIEAGDVEKQPSRIKSAFESNIEALVNPDTGLAVVMRKMVEEAKPYRDAYMKRKGITIEKYKNLSSKDKQKADEDWRKSKEYAELTATRQPEGEVDTEKKKEFTNVDAALNAAIKAAKEGDSKRMNSIINEWKDQLTKDDVDEIKGNLKEVKEDKKPVVKESLTTERKPEVKQKKKRGVPKRIQKVLSNDPQSIREAILHYFINGGRVSREGYAEGLQGKTKELNAKGMLFLKKGGRPIDTLHEEFQNSFGAENLPGFDFPQMVIDVINDHTSVWSMVSEVEKLQQGEAKANVPQEYLDEAESDVENKDVDKEMQEWVDYMREFPELANAIDEFYDQDNNINWDAVKEKYETDKGFFTGFPFDLTEAELIELENLINNEDKREIFTRGIKKGEKLNELLEDNQQDQVRGDEAEPEVTQNEIEIPESNGDLRKALIAYFGEDNIDYKKSPISLQTIALKDGRTFEFVNRYKWENRQDILAKYAEINRDKAEPSTPEAPVKQEAKPKPKELILPEKGELKEITEQKPQVKAEKTILSASQFRNILEQEQKLTKTDNRIKELKANTSKTATEKTELTQLEILSESQKRKLDELKSKFNESDLTDTQKSDVRKALTNYQAEKKKLNDRLESLRSQRRSKEKELQSRNELTGDRKAEEDKKAGLQDMFAQQALFKPTSENLQNALKPFNEDIAWTEKELKDLDNLFEKQLESIAKGEQGEMGFGEKEAVKPEQPIQKIEDFGEKIEGAKKDLWKSLDKITTDEIASLPLSKTFPRPDFIDLVERGVLTEDGAMIMSFLYDNIPPKPRKEYRVGRWVKQVQEAINTMKDFVDNPNNVIRFDKELKESTKYSQLGKEYFWYKDVKKALGFPKTDIRTGQYKIKRFERVGDNKETYSIVKDSYIIKDFNTLQEAADGLVKLLQSKKSDDVKLSIFQDTKTNKYFIGKKDATGYVRLIDNIETLKEARDTFKEQAVQLQEMWQNLKLKPEERRTGNRPRVGVDYRKGKNITPEEFTSTFGFRGVQFGNWVNNQERQDAINEAYDALLDLSNILGIPTRAISLGGELGLAFGARGGGKASAHYESDQIVINLTKTKGAGSLAHEWWHALDSYFSRKRGKKLDFITRDPKQRKNYKEGKFVMDESVRKELLDAFNKVTDVIKKSGLPERSKALDATRSNVYWSDIIEMSARSFESYIIEKLYESNESNDYLANFKETGEWIVDSKFTLENYPYPIKTEVADITEAFNNLFNTIESRQEGDNVVLFKHSSISEGIDNRSPLGLYSTVQRAIESLKQAKGTPQQMKAMLLAGGAKQAELDWYEWDNFVQDKKSLTKEEVQDWFDGRKIEVREVVKKAGGMVDVENPNAEAERKINELNEIISEWERLDKQVEYFGMQEFYDERDQARQEEINDRRLQKIQEYEDEYGSIDNVRDQLQSIYEDPSNFREVGDTKFSQYQLPGGENYREMLLTMPVNESQLTDEVINDIREDLARRNKLTDEVEDAIDMWTEDPNKFNTDHLENITGITISDYYESDHAIANVKDVFKSSHFEEPNIVVHIRANDRITKDRKRILFLEEMQDDWAQLGRKYGFKGEKINEDKFREWFNRVRTDKDVTFEELQKLSKDEQNKYRDTYVEERDQKGVPDMPFKKTDQWVGLAMKRMLIYAAENGYDGIGWTTGEQQAERYDLSKQVDKITIRPGETGKLYQIRASRNGENVLHELVPPEKISDYVGKEIADKAINEGQEIFEGQDLKVGGEGMKAFYDQIIPNWVNKNLKKYGVKSGETQIEVDGKTEKTNFIPITDQIREVVPEGLPMFRLIGETTSKPTTAAELISKKGLSNRQIKTIGNKLRVLAMKTNAKIQVVNRQSELSQSLQDEIGDYSVPGVFKGGTSYLVLENMESEAHAIETFIHEVGIHRGIRNLIPNESDRRDFFNKLVDDIGVDEIRKVVHPNYMKAYDKGELTKHLLGEEYMAYLAEKKLDPNKVLTKKEQTWWDSFIEKINEILSKIFNVKTKITEQDVLKIAEAAIQSNFQMRQSDSSVGRAVDQNIRGESQGNNQAKPIRPGVRFAGELLNEPARKKLIGEVGARNLDMAEEATTRMDNLRVAREMETAGKDAKTIRLATGWERGADKLWRYEVADDQMYYNFPEILTALDEGKYYVSAANDYVLSKTENEALTGKRKGVEISTANTVVYPLEQVIGNDSDTFKAYPTLRGAKVVFDNSLPASSGFWSPSNQEIHISLLQPDSDEVRNILIHELQHAIQDREGFAKGGSVSSVNAELILNDSEMFNKFRDKMDDLAFDGYDWDSPEMKELRKQRDKYAENLLIERYGKQYGKEIYRRYAGEVESRNVQLRSVMSPEMRRETLLSETEDVAREDQIFLTENLGEARSEAIPETIKVNGKDRPTTNSKGQLIHPTVEGIENFWEWFSGKPDNDFTNTQNDLLTASFFQSEIELSDAIISSLKSHSGNLSYFRQSRAVVDHVLNNIGIKEYSDVFRNVLSVIREQPEIINAVIELIPVDVMNNLRRQKLSADMILHDESMLQNLLPVDGNSAIPFARDITNSIIRGVAFSTTKSTSELGFGSGNIFTTNRTGLSGSISPTSKTTKELFATVYPIVMNLKLDTTPRTINGNHNQLFKYISKIGVLGIESKLTKEKVINNIDKNTSKVTDEQGRPLVVYHGTNRDFDSFRSDGIQYFTANEGHANMYTTGFSAKGAHYISQKERYLEDKTRSGESILPVYLSMQNVFDTRNIKERNIFLKEFLNKYGNGTPLDNVSKLPDWTDADDLAEFINDKEYDYDGLILAESHGNITYATFSPTQIKSATGNQGTFSPKESDIRLKLPNIENDESLRKEIESNKEDREKLLSTLNEIQKKLSDRDVAMEVFQKKIVEKYGGKVTDQSNVAAALNLYNPRKQRKQDVFNKEMLDPFIETMKEVRRKAKVTFDDINIYMRAKHAPERNANIIQKNRDRIEEVYQSKLALLDKKDDKYEAKANKLIADKNKKSAELEKQVMESDNFSGFSTEKANGIVKKMESKLNKELVDKFWEQVNAMTNYHLDQLLDGGLISQQLYDKLKEQYQYYVPLKGWDREGEPEFDYVQDIGSILSSPIKAAEGRKSMSDDPLPYIVNAAYSAIVQNEKARVAKAASLLISQNKELFAKHNLGGIRKTFIVQLGFNEDGSVKEVEYDEPPPQEYYDAGMVRNKNNTPFPYEIQRSKYEAKAHEVVAYANGQKYIIWFSKDDPAVANAINRKVPANIEAANAAFQKFPGIITRFMAGNFTVRSINFVFGNLMRDLPLSTVSNFIDNGMKGGARFLYQTINIQPTLRREMKGTLDPDNKMDKYMLDFMEAGGRTGFSYLQDTKAIQRNIKRTLRIEGFLDKAGYARLPITALPKLIKGIELLAGWSEDVSRFATYVAEREGGASHMKAIMAAKNVSVNFDKKGELSGTLGSFYAFFNATVRAVVKYGQMWEKAPYKMGGVHLFLMAQGFIIAKLMDMFGGLDDDDEEKKYDNLSDYKKYFYLNIPIINISIPMPHILRVPHSFGVAAYDVWSGRKSMGDAMKTVAGMSLGEFSPINPQDFISRSGEMSLMPISPTALRPAFELMANQNFMGLPIYKEMYTPKLERETADAAKHFKRVGPGFKGFTKSLYTIGGGNEHMDKFIWKDGEYKKVRELWDWNPAKIEHVYNSYLGGPAKLFNQSAKMAEMTIEAANDIINGKEFKEAIQNYDSRYMPVIYQFRVNTYGSSLERYWYDQLETMGVYESGLSKADKRGEYNQYGDMLRSDLHKKFEQYQVASELIDMFREMMDNVDKDSPEYKEYEKKIRDVMKNYREKVDSLEKEINNK